MSRAHPPLLAALALSALTLSGPAGCSGAPGPDGPTAAEAARDGDPILVIGAGVSGLTAALEAAAAGAQVVVVDRSSVFGGGAILSDGQLALVGTPEQEAAGTTDSVAQAEADLLAWSRDADPARVRRYASESRAEVRDWLVGLGVSFAGVAAAPGHRTARAHRVRGGGLALAETLYRAAIARGVRFHWSEQVTELTVDGGRVVGAKLHGVRDGRPRERRAAAVILASGDFADDVERVRTSWPRELPIPERLLAAGDGPRGGAGLDLARGAGAAMQRLDHVLIDAVGVPDPRLRGADRGGDRGLRLDVPRAIWVNRDGHRFGQGAVGAAAVHAAMAQPGGAFWAIVDADGARAIGVPGAAGADPSPLRARVLDAPPSASGDTLAAVARAADLPAAALQGAVAEHNRGGSGFAIARAPFHAIRLYPMVGATLGGVAIDADGRVLDPEGDPIAGLFAAGGVTGHAGLAGRGPAAGETLASSVLMGRSAGRAAARLVGARPAGAAVAADRSIAAGGFADDACTSCHPREALGLDRPGWRHAAATHADPRALKRTCDTCHAGMSPYRRGAHRLDPLVEADTCRACHARP